ncbi:RNA polymerase [Sphingobacterium sp. ML3W]|uniref:RNA polymerase sigma factor n=1 Tax=Sphingobacterium TaxID=28453 RepID=UPI0004F6E572|nr:MULTISPECIES: RNA polymerase sigma factor [Sphingobacterium]AIM36784.1 RNA polymerase [Sphingobacterium sp. ML3W]MDH5827061.1 RNA polymerase sigma factor [Sphingobacterium faecium]
MGIIKTYFKKQKQQTLKSALEECLQNREQGKAFVYKKYYGYLMAIIIRYVKSDVDAEELTNESFIRIFRRLDSFNHLVEEDVLEKSFRSWIGRISANISIDFLRSKKHMASLDDVDERSVHVPMVYNSSNLEVSDIMKLLDSLPELQRVIFNLYEIEGFSHDEISKKLQIPDSTSRTYLTRAKQKLRVLYLEQNKIGQEFR